MGLAVDEWLEQFYNSPELRRRLEAGYGPLFEQYAAAVSEATGEVPTQVSPEFLAALAATYVAGHLDSSRAQLQEVIAASHGAEVAALQTRLDEWVERRPIKVAAEQTVRTQNALALQQFRDAGVVRKVWQARGADTCPYCSDLDGTTVEIEQPFFTAGSAFQPAGADKPLTFSQNIGHPPAHAGCDCSVGPG